MAFGQRQVDERVGQHERRRRDVLDQQPFAAVDGQHAGRVDGDGTVGRRRSVQAPVVESQTDDQVETRLKESRRGHKAAELAPAVHHQTTDLGRRHAARPVQSHTQVDGRPLRLVAVPASLLEQAQVHFGRFYHRHQDGQHMVRHGARRQQARQAHLTPARSHFADVDAVKVPQRVLTTPTQN